MPFKKFESGDLFYNTIKAKPRFEFRIWNGQAIVNNFANAQLNYLLTDGSGAIAPTGSPPPVVTSSLNNNILAYWSFNSNTVDSIQSISGALSGSSTLAAGKNGNAYSSTGVAQMSFPTTALRPTGTVSVAAWMKTNSGAAQNILCVDLQNYPYGWSGYSLNMDAGKYGFVVGLGNVSGYAPGVDFGSATSSAGFGDNQWHHVVATYDGVNVKMYVDSVLHNTVAFSGALLNYGSEIYGRVGAAQVKIFSGLNDYYYPFNGLIDEAAIWSTALTQQQVTELYNSGSGKYYPF